MRRKDRIIQFIETESIRQGQAFVGVTATEIAQALNIWRNDASVELNSLVQEGTLCKVGKKNIRYFIQNEKNISSAENAVPVHDNPFVVAAKSEAEKETAFSSLVGANGSLKYQIYMAEAAVTYPPNGLNVLITGSTGAGKTLFARTIWEYACEQKKQAGENAEIPFVHFNCAEYADNPQLLLSNLFGHKRGAFTGAVNDKAGLVEDANGGILFLDEIHNLSTIGQELFFTLLDTGRYRRIGDNVNRESHFMLVGATTKPVTDALVDTFIRRIPVVIQIPSLTERPLHERVEFIDRFYSQESARIQMPVRVKTNALNALMAFSTQNGLGALRNVVQISCARAYLRWAKHIGDCDVIEVRYDDLMIQSASNDFSRGDNSRFQWFKRDTLFISGEKTELLPEQLPPMLDLYDAVDTQLREREEGVSGEEMGKYLSHELSSYIEQADSQKQIFDFQHMQPYFTETVFDAAIELLNQAESEFGFNYNEQIPYVLAAHLGQYIKRVQRGQPAFFPDYYSLEVEWRREFHFLRSQIELLKEHCGVGISDDEIAYLSVFVRSGVNHVSDPMIHLTVCSTSYTTAAGIGRFICNYSHMRNTHFVDPSTHGSLIPALEESLSKHHGTRGNIVLVDMLYVADLEKKLLDSTGIKCRIIPFVDQILLFEAYAATAEFCDDIDILCGKILAKYRLRMNSMLDSLSTVFPQTSSKAEYENEKIVVFTVCATGIGTAVNIKTLLEQSLPYTPQLEIISLGASADIPDLAAKHGHNLKLIVGTTDPNISGVPFLQADRVFTDEGMRLIYAILNGWFPDSKVPNQLVFPADREYDELISQGIEYLAPSIPALESIEQINIFIEYLENVVYTAKLTRDAKVRIFMHSFSMLERVVTDTQMEMSTEFEAHISKDIAWFARVCDALDYAFGRTEIPISRVEKYFCMLSLPKQNDLGSFIVL